MEAILLCIASFRTCETFTASDTIHFMLIYQDQKLDFHQMFAKMDCNETNAQLYPANWGYLKRGTPKEMVKRNFILMRKL